MGQGLTRNQAATIRLSSRTGTPGRRRSRLQLVTATTYDPQLTLRDPAVPTATLPLPLANISATAVTTANPTAAQVRGFNTVAVALGGIAVHLGPSEHEALKTRRARVATER